MRKNKIQKQCAVCRQGFEVSPSQFHAYSTCSKPCSLIHRSNKNKGRKITWGDKISAANAGRTYEYLRTPEVIQKQLATRKANGKPSFWKGRKLSPEAKAKMSISRTGKVGGGWKLSLDTRQRMSDSRKGERSTFWRGGVTAINALIRSSWRYKMWRKNVFERDGYSCQECGVQDLNLQAHHILPFAKYPEHRFDVSNGQTLCKDCHKKTDTYLKRPKDSY